MHVEDHPLEYADFEGVIPRGQYGGGDVIVWDRGTWTPAHTDDPAAAIAAGELHFDLTGEKLAGRFALIRRDRQDGRRRSEWLLVHKNDEHARHGWTADDHPRSVLSGRTNDEVAAAPDALWQSGVPAAEAEVRLGQGSSWEPPTDDELAALDAMRRNGRWTVGGPRRQARPTSTRCSSPARDGEPPVTKRELVRHYATIAPLLLPYLAGRPVNLHRYPEGVDRQGFWQQELPAGAPEWVTRWHDPEAGPDDADCRVVADSVPTLAWLANLAAVELHPWTGRLPEARRPTWALIDIDPGTRTTFDQVLVLARLFRTALQHLGVAGMPEGHRPARRSRSGCRSAPGYTYADTRGWVEKVSRAVGATVPELVSWEWTKDRRGGRARLDYTQNIVNKTLVAPWSVRPRPGAPVSVPITWDELDDPDLAPDRWTVRDVPEPASARRATPWPRSSGAPRSYPPSRRARPARRRAPRATAGRRDRERGTRRSSPPPRWGGGAAPGPSVPAARSWRYRGSAASHDRLTTAAGPVAAVAEGPVPGRGLVQDQPDAPRVGRRH